jgi:hypothetical protein
VKVGTKLAKLGTAAEAARAYAGAGLEFRETLPYQGIPRVFARRHGGEDEAVGELGGEILERVDGEIGAAVEQGFLDFLGEEALGADFGERDIGDLVAGGLDDFDAASQTSSRQLGLHPVGLPEGELGTAGCDD